MVWSFLDILGIVLGSHEAWTLEHTRWGNRDTHSGQDGGQTFHGGGGSSLGV